jgi:hypothetical protein
MLRGVLGGGLCLFMLGAAESFCSVVQSDILALGGSA